MAIRSGGMYGNPSSQYTLAVPNTQRGGNAIMPMAKILQAGFNTAASFGDYWANQQQLNRDLSALIREKTYNIKNYKQNIADTFAMNKMSFYSSGLDIKSGTAQDVAFGNRRAMEEDLAMMEYNYYMKEKSIKEAQKANKRNLVGNIVGSVFGAF